MSKFSFTKHYKVALIIPAVIAVVCLVLSLFGQGMNLGIDFTGGSLLTYDMGGEFDMNKVDEAVKAAGITEYQAAGLACAALWVVCASLPKPPRAGAWP